MTFECSKIKIVIDITVARNAILMLVEF